MVLEDEVYTHAFHLKIPLAFYDSTEPLIDLSHQ